MRIERAIVVTRHTRLEELVARFNTKAQAKFYIEQSGSDFSDYEAEDDAYRRALDDITSSLQRRIKLQVIDRSFVPNFLFSDDSVIVTVGQDGLVANTAKYVGSLPIVAVNPDPGRFDGVLLPFGVGDVARAVETVAGGRAALRSVTMAQATLNDGQRLVAFNDLFIGASSHVSARYHIAHGGKQEEHSSSGVLVSTGAGSTGWMSSVMNMTRGVSRLLGAGTGKKAVTMSWDTPSLLFVVREPFRSRTSGVSIVTGNVTDGAPLVIESHMPNGGVIFSDGVESDFLRFNSGATATISVAAQQAQLVSPG